MERKRAYRPRGGGESRLAGKACNDPMLLLSPGTVQVFKTPQKPAPDILKSKGYQVDVVVKSGKHGQVAFGSGKPTPKSDVFACKIQPVQSPSNKNSRAYREYIIFKQLNKLCNRPDIYPNNNFVGFIRLLDGFQGFETHEDDSGVLMHLIMEKAVCTLHEIRHLPFFELRAILFQLLFALAVSQREFGFMHRDLHLKVRFFFSELAHFVPAVAHRILQKNIMLKRAEKTTTGVVGRFKCADTEWFTSGKWIAKISDFGLSSLTLGNITIADEKT